jgi:hypothetical protein
MVYNVMIDIFFLDVSYVYTWVLFLVFHELHLYIYIYIYIYIYNVMTSYVLN